MLHSKKLLFVTHDATRTGAPVVLCWIARWFKQRGYKVSVVIVKEQGALLREYQREFPCYFVFPKFRRWYKRIFPEKPPAVRMKEIEAQVKPDLVFVNSVATPAWLPGWIPSVPFVYYGHEMMQTLRSYLPADAFRLFLDKAALVLSDSEKAAADLKTFCGGTFRSEVQPGFSPPATNFSEELPSLPAHLNRIVLAAALPGWRKGTDLFFQLAWRFRHEFQRSDTGFIWVGVEENTSTMRELQTDIARSGLQETTFVFPPTPNLTAWMRRADVFALLSREDPFPLVALEAGAAGKPVLCFEGTGGAADMIAASGGGWVFPYLDVRQIAETLESVTPDEIAARGAKIKAHVDEYHRYERVMERLEGRVKKVME